jgi:predicted polyphosphate/ATP-dependent NAD kinase
VVLNKALVARDVNEGELLDLVGNKAAKIIVTAIGGQGHIFGRGNQQLSAEIIGKVGKENLAVVASRQKLASLAGRPLMVDTGDPELDRALSGYIKVTTGPREYAMYRVGT